MLTLEYLLLDVHGYACIPEAHEQTARDCPRPIDRPIDYVYFCGFSCPPVLSFF